MTLITITPRPRDTLRDATGLLYFASVVAVVVLIEKTMPVGDRVGQVAGVVSILAGVGLLVA